MARKRRRARAKKDELDQELFDQDTELETTEKISTEVKPLKTAEAPPKAAPVKTTTKRENATTKKLSAFFKDVRAEMRKVSWPDWQKTKNSTLVVIFTLVLLSLCMSAFTIIFTWIADFFFSVPGSTQ
jgi:preprotein translocase subunit SecE